MVGVPGTRCELARNRRRCGGVTTARGNFLLFLSENWFWTVSGTAFSSSFFYMGKPFFFFPSFKTGKCVVLDRLHFLVGKTIAFII